MLLFGTNRRQHFPLWEADRQFCSSAGHSQLSLIIRLAGVFANSCDAINIACLDASARKRCQTSAINIEAHGGAVGLLPSGLIINGRRTGKLGDLAGYTWLTLNGGKHTANKPARVAQLDDGNDFDQGRRRIWLEPAPAQARVVRLGTAASK